MEFDEIIKYLSENLSIELGCMHTGELNNQAIQVSLKIGEVVISRSDCEVLINEVN